MICSNRRVALLALLLGVALTAAGAAAQGENKIPDDVRAVLEKPDRVELLSIHPDRLEKPPKDGLHGWKVLGKTELKGADVQKKVFAALETGVKENTGKVAGCFNPRHGIRAVQGKKTVELVICFECFQVQFYVDGKQGRGFLVTDSPQPAFDQVLKDAKVPLAPAPKD